MRMHLSRCLLLLDMHVLVFVKINKRNNIMWLIEYWKASAQGTCCNGNRHNSAGYRSERQIYMQVLNVLVFLFKGNQKQ